MSIDTQNIDLGSSSTLTARPVTPRKSLPDGGLVRAKTPVDLS
jgi:hypothetical protein